MATETKRISEKIDAAGPGKAFTAADFTDVTSARNAGNALGRMHARGELARAVRGVYYTPEKSSLLGTEVPASVDEVVGAIARANKWIIAPAGDTALNALGLDTQVPARYIYVSSGPYKTYSYGPYTIELRHRANRDLLDCSPITRVVVQALKALGKNNVDDGTTAALAQNLTVEDTETLLKESKGLTSWIAEAAKTIWEERHDGQNRASWSHGTQAAV